MNTLAAILVILAAVAGITFLMLIWYGMTEARKNNDHKRQMERAGLPYTTPQRRGVPPKGGSGISNFSQANTRPKGHPDFYEEV